VARLKRNGLQHHGEVRQHLDAVNRLLQADPVLRVEPVFRAPDVQLARHRLEGWNRAGVELADLGVYLHLVLQPVPPARDAERLIARLNASPVVEIASPAPIASLGGWLGQETPDLVRYQAYLAPAPLGIDAGAAWDFDPVGGRGAGVRVADCEG